jgi:EAL domain-containing protein (putative c-di-GMP-specific phosphodiesterase class I)
LTLSVNLSSRQFSRADLTDFVAQVLEETGVEPGRLVLEITESVLMMKLDQVRENMVRLRELGVALAVDDFGTGYSSLGYLNAYPVNTLKIDRSFVSNMEVDRDKATIVRTVIGMAKSLNLHVVAEGVETQAQADSLRDMDCPVVQGFLFSKPLPAQRIGELLADSPFIEASEATPVSAENVTR